jgi:hypothetical protein
LSRYLQLVPAMIPPSTPDDVNAFTLWHPDLHLDNVFVDYNTMQVTSTIDWQSAAAVPFFVQCGVPKMFLYREPVSLDPSIRSKRPDNYKNLEHDENEYGHHMLGSEQIHKYYLTITKRDNPRHWKALQLHDEVRLQPAQIVQHAWEQNIMFFLKRALMRIVSKWEDLCPGAGPCPVSFSHQEQAIYDIEVENRETVAFILNLFEDNYGLHSDGNVEHARYSEIQGELTRLKATFLEGADSKEQKLLLQKLWPYQDTESAT